MNMMLANMSTLQGANSFTLKLYGTSQALQTEMLNQLSININEIESRSNALQAMGKGNNINITV